MVKIQLELTKDADRKAKQYMLDYDIIDKRIAINKMIEGMK